MQAGGRSPEIWGVKRAGCHFSATQDPGPIFGPGWLPEKEHTVIGPTLHSLTEAFFQGGVSSQPAGGPEKDMHRLESKPFFYY